VAEHDIRETDEREYARLDKSWYFMPEQSAETRIAFSQGVWDQRIRVVKKGIVENTPAIRISRVVMILISRHKWHFKLITVYRP
jgi:hypothetical protein